MMAVKDEFRCPNTALEHSLIVLPFDGELLYAIQVDIDLRVRASVKPSVTSQPLLIQIKVIMV